MSKAEKFIEEHISNRINAIQCYDGDCNPQVIYKPWLTPDQAREAVEIAREEMLDEVCKYIKDNLYKNLYVYNGQAGFPTFQFIEDLKQAMKDE